MPANLSLIGVLTTADNYLTYPVFGLSVFILLLSLKACSKSLARIYCINIALPSFLSTAMYIGIRIALQVDSTIAVDPDKRRIYVLFRNLYAFLRAFTLNAYVCFSTLTVCLAYIGHVRPLLFYSIFQSRKIVILFVSCYVWTVISVLLQFSRMFLNEAFELIPENFNFGPLMWIHVMVALLCYGIMIATYVLTVKNLQQSQTLPSKYAPQSSKMNGSSQSRWRTLKSILIYCTPPNIIAAAAIGGYICDASIETAGYLIPDNWTSDEAFAKWQKNDDFCGDIRVWTQASTNIRLLISCFTAIVAFHEYRQALMKTLAVFTQWMPKMVRPKKIQCFCRNSKLLFRKSNVTPSVISNLSIR
ncbi:hypothetical protein QR680_006212 [Steinernema hermaphroditum]|uniref:Uncharacterized protein n=1 Tax=Steinernema hermaphroditum TaxID=289476 RepID=A0AA39HWW8_9BILA|nr:hypothetical protein QR680_006212 [Steinernema hermaphroditum]